MRVVKEAEVRKNEILDAAAVLFTEKGFDETSTNEILEAVGIARGTLYHHFKSKEDIMDALIERQTARLLLAAQEIAGDHSIPVKERLVRTVLALHVEEHAGEDGGREMLRHLHKPQNALMHQKTQKIMLQRVPRLLAGILEEGVEQGMFHTPYPFECMEMAVTYLSTVFDSGIFELTGEQRATRLQAFLFHMEKLLGVDEGQLAFLTQIFQEGKGGQD